MLALIEEVKSDDGDKASRRRRRIGGGGRSGSARRAVIGDSTNTTPPSSKLLGGGRRHGNRSAAKARKNNQNSRSDTDLLEEALAYSRTGPPVPSPRRVPVVGVKTAARGLWGQRRGGGAGEQEKTEIRATAAALLRLLIVEKQEKMSTHFHKIPFMPQLPDLPSLGEVGAVLSRELGYQSLREQLGRLTPLLKDESTEVIAGRAGECGLSYSGSGSVCIFTAVLSGSSGHPNVGFTFWREITNNHVCVWPPVTSFFMETRPIRLRTVVRAATIP